MWMYAKAYLSTLYILDEHWNLENQQYRKNFIKPNQKAETEGGGEGERAC